MLARTKTALLVLLCTGLLAVPALAVDLDTQALLDIVAGITVTETSALNFGDVALGNAGSDHRHSRRNERPGLSVV